MNRVSPQSWFRMWLTRRLTDRGALQRFLEHDRIYCAYALGDLEPELYPYTEWAGAFSGGTLAALALLFKGLKVPALVLMGEPDGVAAILEGALRPERAYLTCKEEHLAAALTCYDCQAPVPMWRMALEAGRWETRDEGCVPLGRADAQQLQELYAWGPGNAYDPSQIDTGVFYGRLVDGQLVSAAGTHLIGPTHKVAAIGNVFTHPAHRGRGYATAVTRAVIAALLRRQITTIVLNVRQDNWAALSIYEKLGFRCHCPYLEGLALAR